MGRVLRRVSLSRLKSGDFSFNRRGKSPPFELPQKEEISHLIEGDKSPFELPQKAEISHFVRNDWLCHSEAEGEESPSYGWSSGRVPLLHLEKNPR
ncbi:hypothetical protein, partial [Caldisericum sp.]|uniref:hypothetical protein n=1 Tax=Caldisericum sp. TaxID=2499687 RepID=UPI003D1532B1